MASSKKAASLEFLEFIADISHPGTGEILIDNLATWMGVSEDALRHDWVARGRYIPWAIFSDEILTVLDAAQDVTHDLDRTISWYRHDAIPIFGMKTPQQVVESGRARNLAMLVKQGEIHIR